MVGGVVGGLLTHGACNGHDVAGAVIDQDRSGKELLGRLGIGHLIEVGVDLVHDGLGLHIDTGVDVVAGELDELQIGLLGAGVPLLAVGDAQVIGHIVHDHLRIPGVDVRVLLDDELVLVHTLGAVVDVLAGAVLLAHVAAVAVVILAFALEAALGVAAGEDLLALVALGEDHLLLQSRPVLFLGDPALVLHGPQDVLLTLAVVGGTGVGVVQRGVVGDGDEAGGLSHGQLVQILAEVVHGGGLDAVLELAEIDGVQVPLHNGILVIDPLVFLGPEDLFDLTLNGDGVVAGQVLD